MKETLYVATLGMVALLGLIVLAAVGSLSDSLQSALVAIVSLAVGGNAGIAYAGSRGKAVENAPNG